MFEYVVISEIQVQLLRVTPKSQGDLGFDTFVWCRIAHTTEIDQASSNVLSALLND